MNSKINYPIYLIILLLPLTAIGQNNDCEQYEQVIKYIKKNREFRSRFGRKRRLWVDDSVRVKAISPDLIHSYVAGRLGIKDAQHVFRQKGKKKEEVKQMYDQLAKRDKITPKTYKIPCLSKFSVKRNPKTYVGFSREFPDVLVVYTHRIYKKSRHTYGVDMVFFFDAQNNITKVFFTPWIE